VPLRRAASREDFAASLPGRYLAGRTWAHACLGPELFAVLLWGRPDDEDVRALVQSLRLELGAGVASHASLVDASGVTGADLAAFSVLSEYVRGHQQELARQVRRLALVRPGGLPGAVVAGFYAVSSSPYPVELVETLEAALDWLGDGVISGLDTSRSELTTLRLELSGQDPLLQALAAHLRDHLADAELGSAARVLGCSARTLQRRLQAAGTAFQAELLRVRLEEAERRLRDSAQPLTHIALDLGFGSLQHFSASFSKATGLSPSAWREARKPR
jgi:AraC-like DNA-binding protein